MRNGWSCVTPASCLIESAIGGTILLISIVLFYTVMLGTVFASKPLTKPIEMPVAEPYDDHPAPAWLDSWRPWLIGSISIVLVAYGPVMVFLISILILVSTLLKVW